MDDWFYGILWHKIQRSEKVLDMGKEVKIHMLILISILVKKKPYMHFN